MIRRSSQKTLSQDTSCRDARHENFFASISWMREKERERGTKDKCAAGPVDRDAPVVRSQRGDFASRPPKRTDYRAGGRSSSCLILCVSRVEDPEEASDISFRTGRFSNTWKIGVIFFPVGRFAAVNAGRLSEVLTCRQESGTWSNTDALSCACLSI